ncbi:hypothetical protein D9M71_552050 [compost metagenome]
MRGVLLHGEEAAGVGGTGDEGQAQPQLTIALLRAPPIGQATRVLDRHGSGDSIRPGCGVDGADYTTGLRRGENCLALNKRRGTGDPRGGPYHSLFNIIKLISTQFTLSSLHYRVINGKGPVSGLYCQPLAGRP